MLEEVFIPSNHINMVSTMGHLICLDPSSVSRCEGHCRESQICRIRHWSRKAKMKGRLLTCDRFGHFRGLNFLSHAVDVFRYAKFWAHVCVLSSEVGMSGLRTRWPHSQKLDPPRHGADDTEARVLPNAQRWATLYYFGKLIVTAIVFEDVPTV